MDIIYLQMLFKIPCCTIYQPKNGISPFCNIESMKTKKQYVKMEKPNEKIEEKKELKEDKKQYVKTEPKFEKKRGKKRIE